MVFKGKKYKGNEPIIPFIELNEKGAEVYADKNIVDQQEPMAHKSPYSTLEAIEVVQIECDK